MKKLTIELSDSTFNWLEQLAYGLASEEHGPGSDALQARMKSMTREEHDDLGDGVRDIIEQAVESMACGVARQGSWERQLLESLFAYEGTYSPHLFDESNKEEAKLRGLHVD